MSQNLLTFQLDLIKIITDYLDRFQKSLETMTRKVSKIEKDVSEIKSRINTGQIPAATQDITQQSVPDLQTSQSLIQPQQPSNPVKQQPQQQEAVNNQQSQRPRRQSLRTSKVKEINIPQKRQRSRDPIEENRKKKKHWNDQVKIAAVKSIRLGLRSIKDITFELNVDKSTVSRWIDRFGQ